MVLVVTGIGSLIHIYSVGYMAHDPDKVRYFSYLNLFTFFMLMLVLGGNLPLMFVGWEGVGLCSYLLIGFWFTKKSAADAGKKAFIVNRIGDAGLILGMILAFHLFGTLDLVDLANNATSLSEEALWQFGPITAVCLLLFVGACGKSAQIPLHVWLPDAMEGPTPVSALIHAATMVTAGVYMVARLAPLYTPFPHGDDDRRRRRDGHRRARRPPSPWCRRTSRRCWPTRRSASSATCSWPAAWARSAWPCSTCSRTPSSRPCSSSAPAP